MNQISLTPISLTDHIPLELSGERCDLALARLFPDYSRAQLQKWIQSGYVTLDHQIITTVRQKVHTGQLVNIQAPQPDTNLAEAQIVPYPLSIIFEDESLLIINKPVGLVVHPGAGQPDQTLMNALLHHAPDLRTVPRAGIIHRLDKNTSGLLIIARTLSAHHALIKQMKARVIEREYEAVTKGVLIAGGTITANIGRHPSYRTRMAVVDSGKPAITHYRIIEKFRAHTHVRVQLETGRTHQIRVHFAHIHHPLVGDPTYGQHIGIPMKLSDPLKTFLHSFRRQALHAGLIRLQHPITQEVISFQAPVPADFAELLKRLREDVHVTAA